MTTTALTRLSPGERRTVGPAELDAAAGAPPAEVSADAYTGAWLRHHGLVAEPGPEEGERSVRLSPWFAVQGAAALGLVVVIVALAGRPLYGAVALGFLVVGCGAIVGLWPVLARRAPRWLPRGRLLGAVAIIPALVVAAIVVAVLRQQHIHASAADAAARDIRDANTALDERNPKLAIMLLARAESEDASAPGAKTVRARLVIAQSTGRISALEAEVRRLKAELARRR